MNKRRLLLFSVFALLHITTSERNFIDGRCCDHSSRSLFSDTGFSTYETNRVQRFLPEIQQLNIAEKYSNPNKRDTETNRQSRRRQFEYIKQGRNNEIRETLERNRERILSSPTEAYQRRQNFRESIRERSNALRYNRFTTIREEHRRNIRMPSLSLKDNRINDFTVNRFENVDVIRYNNNDRYVHIRDTRDNRKEVKRNLPELGERNTQRHPNRNNISNDLGRILRLERNIRKITSNSVNAYDRYSRLGRIRNLDEELSQNVLSRKINNVRSDDRMNLNDNERLSVNNNRVDRRSIRDKDTANSRTERRARSESAQTRAINELATGTRKFKLELREISRIQRDHTKNRYESERRTQRDRRYNFDRFDLKREKENVLSIRRRSSEETYASRDRSNDARVGFERRNANNNVRFNRDTTEKEISEERRGRIDTSPGRNREYTNSKQYNERNMLESRISTKHRRSEGSDNRDRNENRIIIRRSHSERSLDRDNKRTMSRSLRVKERDDSRRLKAIQRSTSDASDKMIRRYHEVFRYSPEIRENDHSVPNFRELRQVKSIENRAVVERGEHPESDNRREIIRNNNVERRLENQFRLTARHDQNRIISRNHRNGMSVRSDIHIARTNIEDDSRQRSRSLSNDRRLTGSRLAIRKIDDERRQTRKPDDKRKQSRKTEDERRQTRKTDDERRQTRNIDTEMKQTRNTEDRSINMRRMATVVGVRRDSMRQLSENRRTMMSYKIQYENNVFEMKWQYLFYALQLVYLCSILMKIPNDNKENKQKKRFAEWFTSAEYLKID